MIWTSKKMLREISMPHLVIVAFLGWIKAIYFVCLPSLSKQKRAWVKIIDCFSFRECFHISHSFSLHATKVRGGLFAGIIKINSLFMNDHLISGSLFLLSLLLSMSYVEAIIYSRRGNFCPQVMMPSLRRLFFLAFFPFYRWYVMIEWGAEE